jgi:glycine cleavage system transcriptional repressor
MSDQRVLYVITVMSRDRVGIVRDVSTAISQIEGDISDLRQSVLGGYFTMILMATFPEIHSEDSIRKTLAQVNHSSATPLEIVVKQVTEPVVGQSAPPDATYVLTASGPDRVGFVAAVSNFCARHDMNILDLSTTVADGQYVMILLVDLSRCFSGRAGQSADLEVIQGDLKRFGAETGLNVVLQHNDIFKATNEIKML